MTNSDTKLQTQLEDVMAAMDVVDTLRHQQGIAERELDTQGRRERLLNRLRDLYQAQGIEVPDHILEEGIDALEQDRFEYVPVKPGWRTKFAYLWVSRERWGKPVSFFAGLCLVFWLIYFITDVLPDRRAKAELPDRIDLYLTQINADAKDSELNELAQEQAVLANRSIQNGEVDQAKIMVERLASIASRLQAEYQIRVVSRINENSGVWRIPPNNPDVRNFYIIVEGIDYKGEPVSVDVLNEENNQREYVKIWGIRVSENTFYKIAADKQDDGIIQNNVVGNKKHGYLEPIYTISTSGSTITEW